MCIFDRWQKQSYTGLERHSGAVTPIREPRGGALLKWVHYEQDAKGRDLELRYFRDTDGREVDFVVVERRVPQLFVECTSGAMQRSETLSPLLRACLRAFVFSWLHFREGLLHTGISRTLARPLGAGRDARRTHTRPGFPIPVIVVYFRAAQVVPPLY